MFWRPIFHGVRRKKAESYCNFTAWWSCATKSRSKIAHVTSLFSSHYCFDSSLFLRGERLQKFAFVTVLVRQIITDSYLHRKKAESVVSRVVWRRWRTVNGVKTGRTWRAALRSSTTRRCSRALLSCSAVSARRWATRRWNSCCGSSSRHWSRTRTWPWSRRSSCVSHDFNRYWDR